jgi:hypothetical protein
MKQQYTKLAGSFIRLRKDGINLSCHMLEFDSKLKTGTLTIESTAQQIPNTFVDWNLDMHGLPTAVLNLNNITFLNDLVPERQINFKYETLIPWH